MASGFLIRKQDGTSHLRVPSSAAIEPGSAELIELATTEVEKHNKGRQRRLGAFGLMGGALPATLMLRSHDAALLWLEFALPQISDGKYEDQRDSMDFFRLKVSVDPSLPAAAARRAAPSPSVR
jgi:hypothetical protein